MFSKRAVSGVRLLGLGSLGLFSFSGLLIGSFLALELWLPSAWAIQVSKAVLPGIPVANLDVFRIFYAAAYQVIVPLMLGFSAFSMGLTVYTGKRLRASPKKVAYVMLSVVVLSLMVFAALTPATMAISATQTAEYNQFNNQPCSYYIFPDTATPVNYYAQNCATGAISYGGPGNAGGATGTSFPSVTQAFLNAETKGGTNILASGKYSVSAEIVFEYANQTLIGQGPSTEIIQPCSFSSSAHNTLFFQNNLNGIIMRDLSIVGCPTTSIAFISNVGTAIGTHNFYTGLWMSECGGNAISVNYLQDSVISGNTISNCNQNSAGDAALRSANGLRVSITQNHISNTKEECLLVGSSTYSTISNNALSACISTGIALDMGGVTNSVVSGNTIHTVGVGIDLENSAKNDTVNGNTIVSSSITSNSAIQMLTPVANIVISDNVCNAGYYAIYSTGSNNILVNGNYCQSPLGIHFFDSQNITIIGNTVIGDSTNNGITLTRSTTTGKMQPSLIQGNILRHLNRGIETDGIVANIIGNSISDVTGFGILLKSATVSSIVYFPDNSTILSNSLINWVAGSSVAIDIQDGQHVFVSGNSITNFATGFAELNSDAKNNFWSNNALISVTTAYSPGSGGSGDKLVGNFGYNPIATSSVTAGTSVWTYTNNDGYDEVMQLSTVGGISAETCNGETSFPITAGSECILAPGGTMAVTWATTAPIYTKVPLFA